MTNKKAIKWLKLELEKGVSWDDTSESTKNIREQAEVEIKEAFDTAIKALERQPCEDCVSRQDALNCVTFHEFRYRMVEDIKALPSVTPKEKTGHWEYVQYDYNPNIGNWHCSECRSIVIMCVNKKETGGTLYKYCPNCGARMVEPQESEIRNDES